MPHRSLDIVISKGKLSKLVNWKRPQHSRFQAEKSLLPVGDIGGEVRRPTERCEVMSKVPVSSKLSPNRFMCQTIHHAF